MGFFKRKSANKSGQSANQPEKTPEIELVNPCLCGNGHSLISDQATFSGHAGITLKLRNENQEGLLALSPVVGDKDRTFFETDWAKGEIVEICCPTCSEPLPIYNECFCGADLVAMFTKKENDFANCVGICQRIGCTHADIKGNVDLRVKSRTGLFDKGSNLYGR